eukprot:GILK01007538.1.p1 GENE.GILK01007538.1~~GILK01007538.1.p1  ORF type:complete len:309 (-),score=21.26 GILK01007538.1:105-1031(-)
MHSLRSERAPSRALTQAPTENALIPHSTPIDSLMLMSLRRTARPAIAMSTTPAAIASSASLESAEDVFRSLIAPSRVATKRAIAASKTVQMCFLVDCTSSMGPWIQRVKQKIAHVMEPVKKDVEFRDVSFRFSFVGYRDIDDGPNRLVKSGFSSDPDFIVNFLEGVQDQGGADFCEDALGGLDAALDQEWDGTPEGTKLIVHIADAPCHGKRFHSLGKRNDSYLDSTHWDDMAASIFADMIRHQVDYYFVRLSEHTDQMIEVFKSLYNTESMELKVIDLSSDASKFLAAIVESVKTSVRNSLRRSKMR